MSKKRVLSGIQPTGKLHLGNYIGAISNWVKLQNEYDCFFFIADWHALTTAYEDPGKLHQNSIDAAIDLLAAGIDPNLCTLFVQSDVPEHAELHLLLSMITPLAWLERVPTYKSKIEELSGKDLGTYGFLGYPVLQAADILMYRADFVPVGQDQVPHIELTREIGRRFNAVFKKNVFHDPMEKLTSVPTLPGLDGRKMSKSYGNTIALSDSDADLRKKISSMITDPSRAKKDDPGHPEVCAVYSYWKVFNPTKAKEIEAACKKGQIGCVECKKQLAEVLSAHLAPLHAKRAELLKNPKQLNEILAEGAQKARQDAKQMMAKVRDAVGLL
jgi:tryptophanyl-tRNA synthetase